MFFSFLFGGVGGVLKRPRHGAEGRAFEQSAKVPQRSRKSTINAGFRVSLNFV